VKHKLEEIRQIVAAGPPWDPRFVRALARDKRTGARALYATVKHRLKKVAAEEDRMRRCWALETEAAGSGYRCVAGVDEAGRGPLAGPIVAAAVVLCEPVDGVNDSKLLPPEDRERLYDLLNQHGGHAVGVAVIEHTEIDAWGIQTANYRAMLDAAAQLTPPPDYLLVDGFALPHCPTPHRRVVKGDTLSLSIGAASIVAKVVRDRIMTRLHARYPQYGFNRNMGYSTAEHLAALERHGPSPVHRMSFAPMARRAVQAELAMEGRDS
jgi:ribonuclease HII